MTRIIILGTGGNCLDILDTLNDINSARGTRFYDCIGFLDDDPARQGERFLGLPVLGRLSEAGRFEGCSFVNGIGSVTNFWKKPDIIRSTGMPLARFETVVHPTASVSRTATLGCGTVVFQNVTITTNVRVGNHVVILPNTVVSHDDVIGDYVCIAGGVCISGCVEIGRCCYLGTNATIAERLTVGEFSLIGMGSVVRHPVGPNSVMVGSPARLLRNTR